jgi:ankyrin repeat protein
MVEVTDSVSAYAACLGGLGATGIDLTSWIHKGILPSGEYGIRAGWDLGLVLRAAAICGHLDLAVAIAGHVDRSVCTMVAAQAINALAAASPPGSVAFILEFLADDFDFTAALEIAVRATNTGFVREVLPHALRPERPANLGVVIREMVRCGNVEALQMVVDSGRPLQFSAMGLDWKNSGKCLPLLFQAWGPEETARNATTIVTRLLQVRDSNGASLALQVAGSYQGLFLHVGECGSVELAKLILARYVPAVCQNEPDRTRLFINFVTPRGTALSAACLAGDVDMVQFLLTVPGIDATLPNWNTGPLRSAARARSVPILRMLVEHLRGGETLLPNSLTQACRSAVCAILRTKPPKPIEAWRQASPSSGTPKAEPVEPASPNILADVEFSGLTQSVLDLIVSHRLPFGPHEWTRLLLQAAKTKNLVLLNAALQFPEINVNAYDKRGDTPLILCCRNYDMDGIKLLLANELQVNWQNAFGETAFSIAASLGQWDVVTLLLHRADFLPEDSNASLALIGAILHRHSAIADAILGLDFFITGTTRSTFDGRAQEGGPLHAAIVARRSEFVAKVIAHSKAGVNPAHLEAALFDAISANSVGILRRLLGPSRFDINAPRRNGRSLLAHAISLGFENIIDFILQHESFDFAKSDPAGCLAATTSEYLIVKLLPIQPIDANMSLPPDSTSKAAAGSTRSPNPKGATSLLTRVIDLRADKALDILLESIGTDLKAKDSKGRNGLHAALYANANALYRLLLSPEIDVDAPDGDGLTPLMIAVKTRNAWAAAWLIERLCKLDTTNVEGQTAWDMAFAGTVPAVPHERDQYLNDITAQLLGVTE